jgi:hypothetical protein
MLGLNPRNKTMGRYHWGSIIIGLIIPVLLFSGCGASKAVKQARQTALEAYEIQKPVQVRTSNDDKRPKWTKQTAFEDDSGMLYFSGGFLSGADYPVTVRCANAEALKVAVQSISQFIRSEFTQYVKGSNLPPNPIDRTEIYLHSIGDAERNAMNRLQEVEGFSGIDASLLDESVNMSISFWKRKVKRPSLDVLMSEIKNMGYSAVGRKYGVSDNAVRKWIKGYKQ